VLFLLREGLVEMDVPTRQSYGMAVVRPEERTLASGVTNLIRLGAWAVAPAFAGIFIKSVTQAAPLFIGAGLKIVYDIALYIAFRKTKPPEEGTRFLCRTCADLGANLIWPKSKVENRWSSSSGSIASDPSLDVYLLNLRHPGGHRSFWKSTFPAK
jgi:hypothetical protein